MKIFGGSITPSKDKVYKKFLLYAIDRNIAPSEEDIECRKKVAGAGRLLGIEVRDHIVLRGSGNYYSLYKTKRKRVHDCALSAAPYTRSFSA